MKKKHKIKDVIFDLDGTLLDSLQDIAESMNKALAESGLPEHPLEAYKDFVGDGLFTLTEIAMPASRRKTWKRWPKSSGSTMRKAGFYTPRPIREYCI